MASRLVTVVLVATIVLISACTGTAADPTTPADVFAPTPTIGEPAPPTTVRRETTTTADVERLAVHKVDPATLEPLPGLEPIPMGDWMWGQASPNGMYYAAGVADDDSGEAELRLIDVANWSVAGDWDLNPEMMMVTDDGTIYLVSAGQVYRAGAGGTPRVATLPEAYYPWLIGPIVDETLVAFGSRYDDVDQRESASIVTVDLTTGSVSEIDLPQVYLGVDPDAEELWAGSFYVEAAVTWDAAGARALVVHGDADVVSEVDLKTGIVSDHEVDFPGEEATGYLRTAGMNPDGTVLHVATGLKNATDEDLTWEITTVPGGVVSVDTTTWQVTARSVEPISRIYLSPDGSRILGWGDTSVETPSGYSNESTGLFVLDWSGLATINHVDPEKPDQWYGPFSFNQELGLGYVMLSGESSRIDVIDLATGEVRRGVERDSYTEMIGPIGAMGITTYP